MGHDGQDAAVLVLGVGDVELVLEPTATADLPRTLAEAR
jgi:hypothetical protein